MRSAVDRSAWLTADHLAALRTADLEPDRPNRAAGLSRPSPMLIPPRRPPRRRRRILRWLRPAADEHLKKAVVDSGGGQLTQAAATARAARGRAQPSTTTCVHPRLAASASRVDELDSNA
jgi:hypothetical protein